MILLRKTGKIYPNTYPMGTRCDKNKNVNYITILGKLIKNNAWTQKAVFVPEIFTKHCTSHVHCCKM